MLSGFKGVWKKCSFKISNFFSVLNYIEEGRNRCWLLIDYIYCYPFDYSVSLSLNSYLNSDNSSNNIFPHNIMQLSPVQTKVHSSSSY